MSTLNFSASLGLICVLFAGVSFAGGCKAGKNEVGVAAEVVEDAYVWQEDPDTAFGLDDNRKLYAGYYDEDGETGDEQDIYLYFDVSSIPAGATVTSAQLLIYISDTANTIAEDFIFSVEDADDSWTEGTLTWNNSPASTAVTTFDGPDDEAVGWLEIELPVSLIQGWVDYPGQNNGIGIMPQWNEADGDNDGIAVDSSENGSGNKPTLIIYYEE